MFFVLVAGYWLPIRKNEVPPTRKTEQKKSLSDVDSDLINYDNAFNSASIFL